MPFIVVPGGGAVVIIGQMTFREKLGIDAMAQVMAPVLKSRRRQDDPGMGPTAATVADPDAGAVVRVVVPVTAFGPGRDVPGGVEDDVTLTLLSPRPRIFQNSNTKSCGRVGEDSR